MSKNRVNTNRPILVSRMGIDLRVPITDMAPEYSPFMINFHCHSGRLKKRKPHSLNAISTGSVSGSAAAEPKVIALPNSDKVI